MLPAKFCIHEYEASRSGELLVVEWTTVPQSREVPLARDLHNRFTAQEKSVETVYSWYEEVPSLFLFAVDGDEVIGVCTGRPRGEREVSLAGIGIESNWRGEGIGTRLVGRFEENASAVGIERVSVASAGGKVDDFYIDNGFRPEKILVMDPEGDRRTTTALISTSSGTETRTAHGSATSA